MNTPRTQLALQATLLAKLLDDARRHEEAGQVEQAMDLYRRVLGLKPDEHEALHRLGLCALLRGDLAEAETRLHQALHAHPTLAAYPHDLGRMLAAAGRNREASERFHEALRLSPDHAPTHLALGQLHQRLGRVKEAENCYRKALRHDPSLVEAHDRLGTVLEEQGRGEEATAAFEKALDLRPDRAGTWVHLARNLARRDQTRRALEAFLEARARQPALEEALTGISELLRDRKLKAYPPELEAALRAALESNRVRNQDLARPVAHFLRLKHQVDAAVHTGSPSLESLRQVLERDPLWLDFLCRCVNVDSQIERLICACRKALLLESWNCEELRDESRQLAVAIATLLHRNEYLYPVDEDERQVLNQLTVFIEKSMSLGESEHPTLENELLLHSMYAPPEILSFHREFRSIPGERWSADVRELFELLLQDEDDAVPLLGIGIPRLSPTALLEDDDDDVPAPYLDVEPTSFEITPRPLQAILRERFPQCEHLPQPGEQLRVLVAGCGTGEGVLQVAREYRGAEVVATDESRRRLLHLQRAVRGLGLKNVRLYQSDILHVERLRQRFDLIECTGVLSRLSDPLTALRSLLRVLEPGGLFRIGLCSRRARRRVMDARRYVLQAGIGPGSQELIQLRHEILTGREPELVELLLHSEFYTLSGCRKLLFQEIEHRFTPLQIDALLVELGLQFIGFEFSDLRVPQVYREHAPLDPGLTDLESWEHFEEEFPTTFMHGMVFWARAGRETQGSATNVPEL